MIKLGLVGVGRWGQRYLETVGRRDDCQVVAVARASQAPVREHADALPCSDWRELLVRAERGDLDGLIVASTPENQAEVAEAAAPLGVPVLVEKPLGMTSAAAARVHEAFANSALKAPVLVNFIHLFSPAFRALELRVRERRQQGQHITAIRSEGANAGPYRSWSTLHDYAPHDLSMCLKLLDADAGDHWMLRHAEKLVSSTRGVLYDASFDVGRASIKIHCGNGARAKVRRLQVDLSDGTRLVYDDLKAHSHKLEQDGDPVTTDLNTPLDCVLGEFIARVKLYGEGTGSNESTAALRMAVMTARIVEEVSGATVLPAEANADVARSS